MRTARDTRICIVTTSHPSRNPRVLREAHALSAAGFHVTVLASALSHALTGEDDELIAGAFAIKRPIVLDDGTARRRGRIHRVSTRLARVGVRTTGLQLPAALGYGPRTLLRAARRERSDLYIVHLEAGAWVGCKLLDEGFEVAADFEDWHSEDLLPSARIGRPLQLLQRCEAELLRRAAYVSTTSHALARALADRYASRLPAVIYNAMSPFEYDTDPARKVSLDRPSRGQRPSLYWFSQTVGKGRGLETLIEALRTLAVPIELHVRGHCAPSDLEWLRDAFAGSIHELHVHGPAPSRSMLTHMCEHDIGLALELTMPSSRDLTVTNKILHYLRAGLAVVATATSGQREIADAAPRAIALCAPGDSDSLALALEQLLAPERLRAAKAASIDASQRFSWERQSDALVQLVRDALIRTR